ncbi:MAG: DUF1833 family protein [Pseudomonadota bacterium]
MSDLLSDALEEAYASAPIGIDVWETIEIRHSELSIPARFVLDHGEKIGETAPDAHGQTQDIYGRMVKLEADAPADAGEWVSFLATAFEVQHPDSAPNRPPEMALILNNVPGDIMAALGPAAASGEGVDVTYREFLSDDPETLHFRLTGLTLKRVGVTALRVEGRIGFGDLFNKVFPASFYNVNDNPSLVA